MPREPNGARIVTAPAHFCGYSLDAARYAANYLASYKALTSLSNMAELSGRE